ncbi:MAG TPA: hypothetical protein VFN49_13695 [Candidatus Aquilonibacter sp.]|nr:hypothetical protein [Candidatus Aquilonibacter sp.]
MNRSTLGVLVRRTFAHVRRHALLFCCIAVAGIGVQWLLDTRFPGPGVELTAGIVAGAIVDAIVLGIVKGDVDGWNAAQTWDRIGERLWAVIIVNFVATYVAMFGLVSVAAGDLADRLLAIPTLLIAASVVFAEAIAVVADDEAWWFVVVRAIGGSIRVAWSNGVFGRTITLFVLQLVPGAISSAIVGAVTHGHPPASSFWTDVPVGIVFSIPLDVLIVLAFFDASGYEPNRTCGE